MKSVQGGKASHYEFIVLDTKKIVTFTSTTGMNMRRSSDSHGYTFSIRLLHWTPTPLNYLGEWENVNNKIIISSTGLDAMLSSWRLSHSKVD